MADFTNDELYGPCPCGSGKKLKFCCRDTLTRRSPAAEERAIDGALEALHEGGFEVAVDLLQPFFNAGSNSPMLHTLLAEARFGLGATDEAIAGLRDVVERLAPGHQYAGAILAHLLILRGERAAAAALVDRLMRVRSRRSVDVFALIPPLALLERDAELLQLVDGAERPLQGAILIAAAVAALNLQQRNKVRHYVDEFVRTPGGTDALRRLLQRAADGQTIVSPWPRLLACEPGAIVPAGAILRVLKRLDDAKASPDRALSDVLRHHGRLFVVASIADGEIGMVRGMCTIVARLHPAVAREDLQTVWESAIVPVEVAQVAVQVALEHGLVAADEDLAMFIDGVRQVVRVSARQIGGDASVLESVYRLPEHLGSVERQALADSSARRLPEALRGFERILEAVPDHPASSFNRLVTLVQMGRLSEQAQIDGLRQLLARSPRYLVARTTLATLLLLAKRIDEASEVLQEAHLPDAADAAGHGAAAVTLARIALARGDIDTARRVASMARALFGDDAFRHRAPDLAIILNDGDQANRSGRHKDRKQRKTLQRTVRADAPTALWFEHLTVAELKDALRFHGVRLTGSPRREHFLQELVRCVDEGGAVDVIKGLKVQAVDDVVRALVEAGGRLPYDVAARRFSPVKGPLKDAGPIDPLALVLSSGVAIAVAVDGMPSLALPPAALRALGGTPSSTSSVPVAKPNTGGRWQLATVALPPIGSELPLLVIVFDETSDQVLEVYLHPRVEPTLAATIALGRVLARSPMRPTRLEVDDAAFVAAVAAVLPDATVVAGECEGARAALSSATTEAFGTPFTDPTQAERETWAARGVPLDLARTFHEAAAALYLARPWDVVPDDGCAIVMSSDDGLLRDCAVVVIGQAGLSSGILINENLDVWRRARRAEVDRQPDALPARLAVEFNRADGVPAPTLAEMKRQKLPLAGPAAVPWLMAFEAGAKFAVATVDDTRRALLVMRTLCALLAAPSSSSWRNWRSQEPLPTRVTIDGGVVRVAYETAVW